MIRWLMASNPADRPSAAELMRSPLIPPAVGDEQLDDLLRSLKDRSSTLDRVVDSVFNLPAAQADPDELPGTPATGQVGPST